MRFTYHQIIIAPLILAATPVMAQDQTDPPSAITVSGSVTLASDYRLRGISQRDKDVALQGGITVAHESGAYVGIWGSTIDDYVAAGANQEFDVSAGFKKDLGGTTLDVGAVYYFYPSADKVSNHGSDFIETYASVSHILGPVSGKATVAYAPKQRALALGSGKADNLYIAADLSAGIPTTPITVNAHVGRSVGPSRFTVGKGHTDWSLGASHVWKDFTLGLTYVDTNKALYSPSGKNIAQGGVLGTVSFSF